MSLASKITCVSVLIGSFLLILATGRVNIRNFEKVQHSIEEIYKDRLVVKGLIFKLSSLLHEKEVALLSGNKSFFASDNNAINEQIDQHLKDFRATELTTQEELTLNQFSRGITALQNLEKQMTLESENWLTPKDSKNLMSQIETLRAKLKILSNIQLSEGERKLSNSEKAVESMNQFESIENYAMLFLCLLIAAFIFVPGPNKQLKKDI
jgi:hypothetical protein